MNNQAPFAITNADQRLLVLASIFENDFSVDWLQEISGARASDIFTMIESQLAEGILERTGRGRFRFLQDALRKQFEKQLPPEERKRLDKIIAGILLSGAQSDENDAQNAGVYLLRIENDVVGCQWLLKAGEAHRRKYRYSEALQCYRKILVDLENDHDEEAAKVYAEAAIGYSKISDAETEFYDVITALENALSRIARVEDQTMMARLELHLAKNQWLGSRYDEALNHFDRGRQFASRIEDPRLQQSLSSFSTFFYFVQGRLRDVVQHYDSILPDIEKYPINRFPLLSAAVVGFSYACTGQLTQGMGMMNAIYLHAIEKGDLYIASFGAYILGLTLYTLQRNDEAVQYFKDAIDRAQKAPNNLALQASLVYMAALYYRKQDPTQFQNYYEQYVNISQKMKVRREVAPCLLELSLAVYQGKLPPLSDLSLEKEIKNAAEGKNLITQGLSHHFLAMMEKHRGASPEKVLASLEISAKMIATTGNQIALAPINIDMAREYCLLGEEVKARQCIQQVSSLLDTAGENFVPKELQFLLADFSRGSKSFSKNHQNEPRVGHDQGKPRSNQTNHCHSHFHHRRRARSHFYCRSKQAQYQTHPPGIQKPDPRRR